MLQNAFSNSVIELGRMFTCLGKIAFFPASRSLRTLSMQDRTATYSKDPHCHNGDLMLTLTNAIDAGKTKTDW